MSARIELMYMRNKTEHDHVRKCCNTHFNVLSMGLLLLRVAELCVSAINCLVYPDIFTAEKT